MSEPEHEARVGLDDLPEVPHPPKRRSAGELAFGDDAPSLLEAMGGPVGMAESAIPSIAFLIATTAGAEVPLAAGIAVGGAVLLAVARLVRRETVQFALTGLLGVAICAGVAVYTGDAKGFFLPSFAINIFYGSLALVSIAVRRPFVGYIAENLRTDRDPDWRDDARKMRRYTQVSLLWVGIFASRLIVQVPIYLSGDDVVFLGTVKLVMGYPLFGLGVWLSWLLTRGKSLPGGTGGAQAAGTDHATQADDETVV